MKSRWSQAVALLGVSLWGFIFWLALFGTILTGRILPGPIGVMIVSPAVTWYMVWSYKRQRAGRWIHKWGFW